MENFKINEYNLEKFKAKTPNEIKDYIKMRLTDIESQYHVTVLYAVESGSRAWGFDNKKSDYDIRFIYCGKLYDYLNIDGMKRSVIQRTEGKLFDFVGWDIVKALKLMRKSNPQMIEWGEADDRNIYVSRSRFGETLHNLSLSCWDKKTLIGHYMSTATKDYDKHVVGKKQVDYKKYLYILRCVLCAGYVKHYETLPPVKLERMLDNFAYIGGDRYPLKTSAGHTYTLAEVEDFDEWNDPLGYDDFEVPYEAESIIKDVTAYRYEFRNKENLKLKGNRIEVLDDFIESEIEYFKDWMKRNDSEDKSDMTDNLNGVFRNVMNLHGNVSQAIHSKLI